MQRTNLYKQHDMPIQLSYASNANSDVINNPMYNNRLVIYKGICSKLEFAIKNQDRKVLKPMDKTLYMFVQNKEGTKKWVKELWCEDASWGRYQVKWLPEETEDMDAGAYKSYFIAIDDEGEEEVLYTGAEDQTLLDLYVIANQYDTFIPSEEILPEGWLYVKKSEDEHYYESDWVKADNSKNHGFAFYVNDYTVIEIKGSNELEPTHEDKSWFVIDTVELSPNEPTVINKFYQLGCKWVKFETTDLNGLEKILYRN